jgi:hypothetical protein
VYIKYMRKAESRKIRFDHLKMKLGINTIACILGFSNYTKFHFWY